MVYFLEALPFNLSIPGSRENVEEDGPPVLLLARAESEEEIAGLPALVEDPVPRVVFVLVPASHTVAGQVNNEDDADEDQSESTLGVPNLSENGSGLESFESSASSEENDASIATFIIPAWQNSTDLALLRGEFAEDLVDEEWS